MEILFKSHLDRIKEGAGNTFGLHNLSKYVEKYIKIDGQNYTFGDKYGFQATIIDDTSRVTNTVKPAQIGLTTSTMAYIVAGAATQPKFNSIYSLPTTTDAAKLVTTKLNPLIQGSPAILHLLDPDVDNNELKKIGHNFIFIRGSRSETAALSISADALVADEIDRSDPDTLKQFRSRLQASMLQVIKQFSTPTLDGVGIAKEAETSKRFRHFARCKCCGFAWLPTYHENIRIPGYNGSLEDITRSTIKDINWQHAHWECPNCGKDPQLHPNNLEWVCENPDDNYEANTYFITPVTACLVLRPAYLVRTSTEFNTRSEWKNQVLGETSAESNEQITAQDVLSCEVDMDLYSSDMHFMGCDMGLMCAVTVGRLTADGTLLVVHREMVPISVFETRRMELIRKYKVLISVHDTQPYVTEIMRICDIDRNAYGCIFVTTKVQELYTIQEKEKDDDAQAAKGSMNLRMLKASRTMLLDEIRDMFKSGQIVMARGDKTDSYRDHYTSLRRVQNFVKDELVFQWVKTDGEDHMLFSLGYLYLACKLRGRAAGWLHSSGLVLVKSFHVKNSV